MSPFRRILVPIDFSDGSREALRMARQLAAGRQARIEALHVLEPSPWMTPTQLVWVEGREVAMREYLERQLSEQLEAMVTEIAAGDGRVTGRVVVGSARGTILRELREQGYDLVIMGTHGRTGLSRLFLGSVAEHVVRAAPCPVLTVRCDPPEPADDKDRDARGGVQADS